MSILEQMILELQPELAYKDIALIPGKCIVESRKQCNTRMRLGDHQFEMPIYPANMRSVVNEETCAYLAERNWFYTMHRFGASPDFVNRMHDLGLLSSISVGVKTDLYEALKDLPYFVTVDIANAWDDRVREVIQEIKDRCSKIFVIVGNVATKEAVEELQYWGADAIKVGIAGGSVCITRMKTGFHRPMVSTLLDCTSTAKVPIIADGGIETYGDISKALACGATAVMSGNLFAGYDESAGDIVEIDGKQYKEYYGSASEYNKEEKRNIEGKKVLVSYRGGMDKLLQELKEDLQSSISYAGGKDLTAFNSARKVRV